MDGSIFKAYDIRGTYPEQINEKVAVDIGRAFGTSVGRGRVFLARDFRDSSTKLSDAIRESIIDTGISVSEIGTVPTPVLYFAIAHMKYDGGVMVSASHNPPNWNGFKLCGKEARVISQGFGMEKVQELALLQGVSSFSKPMGAFATTQRGTVEDAKDLILEKYMEHAVDNAKVAKKYRIGLDPGNGAWAKLASKVIGKFYASELEVINDTPKAVPDRASEPTFESLAELRKLVVERKLDIGIAYDGDGDRAVFIDEKGGLVPGDTALALFVRHMAKPRDKIVYELSCSDIVDMEIKRRSCEPIMTRVGHSYVVNAMIDNKARFGGEISGHLYFRETYGVDDAFFAGLKMLELLSNTGKGLSELVAELPKRERSVKEFDVEEARKFAIVDYVKSNFKEEGSSMVTLDGAKAVTRSGWFVIRASNTSPKIRLIAEAEDTQRLKETLGKAEGILKEAQNRITS